MASGDAKPVQLSRPEGVGLRNVPALIIADQEGPGPWLADCARPRRALFIITAASRSRKVWFWSTFCGLGVAFLSYNTYFFMDVAAVPSASYLACNSVDFEQPEKPGEQWAQAE